MSGWLIALIVVGAVIVIFSVIVAVVHERLTIRRSVAINAFAFVEAQLHQRHALAEELLKAAPEEAAATLGAALEQARASAEATAETPQDGDCIKTACAAQDALAAAAAPVIESAAGEKAEEIREGIEEAEEHLSFATATFNWAVDAYNRSRKRFPGRGFARLFGFRMAGTWGEPGSGVGHGS